MMIIMTKLVIEYYVYLALLDYKSTFWVYQVIPRKYSNDITFSTIVAKRLLSIFVKGIAVCVAHIIM